MADWEKKQVVFVVEGTAALGRYWHSILNNYVCNIIRIFRDNGSSSEDEESLNNADFAVVVFKAAGGSSATLSLHNSKWTNDANCAMKWLCTINFNSDAVFSDTATAHGLYQALMMFHSSNERSPNGHLQKHCILIATCNPDSSPHFLDVVKLFQQSNVSLSSIYESKLPKQRAIWNVGEVNPSDTGIETVTQSLHHVSLNAAGESKDDTRYVKVWEGDLYAVPPVNRFLLTRVHAYMRLASSKFVEDWPSSIEIAYLCRINTESLLKKLVGNPHLVVFYPMDSHPILSKMQRHNLCGVVKLPSQLMFFIVTDNPSRFLGYFYPVVSCVYLLGSPAARDPV
ncbi:mediator of RNA polymerase II transcription subunit 25-like isoform X2 [Rutidosis leptorrhynchoides]|uniref:mediator of RNA polymerase II transcription subunit 25-like isoform X2 n=1 Tax=Rutidosis leptorrhynchoides TaxID=125765 RepID=UPI003A9A003D